MRVPLGEESSPTGRAIEIVITDAAVKVMDMDGHLEWMEALASDGVMVTVRFISLYWDDLVSATTTLTTNTTLFNLWKTLEERKLGPSVRILDRRNQILGDTMYTGYL